MSLRTSGKNILIFFDPSERRVGTGRHSDSTNFRELSERHITPTGRRAKKCVCARVLVTLNVPRRPRTPVPPCAPTRGARRTDPLGPVPDTRHHDLTPPWRLPGRSRGVPYKSVLWITYSYCRQVSGLCILYGQRTGLYPYVPLI